MDLDAATLSRALRRQGIGYKNRLGDKGQTYIEQQNRRMAPPTMESPDVGQMDAPGTAVQYMDDMNQLPPSEFMAKWGHLPGANLK